MPIPAPFLPSYRLLAPPWSSIRARLSPSSHLYTQTIISCRVSHYIFCSSRVTPFLLLHFCLASDFSCMFDCRCRREWHLGICGSVDICMCVKNVGDSEVMDNRIPFLFHPHSWEIPSNEGEVGHTLWGWPELLTDGWAAMTQKSGIKLTISVQKWWSSLSCCAGEWAKLLISVPVTIYWSS